MRPPAAARPRPPLWPPTAACPVSGTHRHTPPPPPGRSPVSRPHPAVCARQALRWRPLDKQARERSSCLSGDPSSESFLPPPATRATGAARSPPLLPLSPATPASRIVAPLEILASRSPRLVTPPLHLELAGVWSCTKLVKARGYAPSSPAPRPCAVCARRPTRSHLELAGLWPCAAPRAHRPVAVSGAARPPRLRPMLAGHCNGAPPSGRMYSIGQGREGRCEADVWDQHVIGLCCILFLELLAKHPLWTAQTPLRDGST
jgi:hypothetical protein